MALAIGATSSVAWLDACGGGPATTGRSAGGLEALARRLDGRLVVADHPEFRRARRLYITRFDAVQPLAVAYCAGPDDVRRAVEWGRESEVPVVARNGGHSYAGYSSAPGALVVDLSRLRRIAVDDATGIATIGAGSLLVDVYRELARRGLAIPAGSCPTVGVTGLTLGGGIGLSSRRHGLTADSLVGLDLVTAAGELVKAGEREREDLFWASRGGGGGNFGVATELRFETHPVGRVATYMYEWDWADAEAVADAWQRSAPAAPDELFSICKLARVPADGRRTSGAVTSFGQLFGSAEDLEELLRPLRAAARPRKRDLREMGFLDAQLLWAGCTEGASDCPESPARAAYKAKSHFFARPLPQEALATAVRWLGRWPGGSDPQGAAIQFDTMGGAINRVPLDATAFVHRDQLFHGQYLAFWSASDPARVADANLDWIEGFYEQVEPFASGQAYQNYIDPDLAGWEQAYYGSALARLREVKQRYDPDGFFSFPQGIIA